VTLCLRAHIGYDNRFHQHYHYHHDFPANLRCLAAGKTGLKRDYEEMKKRNTESNQFYPSLFIPTEVLLCLLLVGVYYVLPTSNQKECRS
jgi:hypothetical protein